MQKWRSKYRSALKYVLKLPVPYLPFVFYRSRSVKEAQVKASINQKLIESGERERYVVTDSLVTGRKGRLEHEMYAVSEGAETTWICCNWQIFIWLFHHW